MRSNGFFDMMIKEAMDELASGEAGTNWRDCSTNILFLAAFGMLYNEMMHNIARPLWFAASAIGISAAGFLVNLLLS